MTSERIKEILDKAKEAVLKETDGKAWFKNYHKKMYGEDIYFLKISISTKEER